MESGARISFDAGNIIYDTSGAYEDLAEGVTANGDFLYTIRMANGAISTAEVTITVTGQNDAPVAPVANRDVIVASASTTALINANWLLQNDLDPSGQGLTITSLNLPSDAKGGVVNPTLDASGALISFTVETHRARPALSTLRTRFRTASEPRRRIQWRFHSSGRRTRR